MDQHTRVKEIRVRSRSERWMSTNAELIDIKQEQRGIGACFFQLDKLVRNFAIVAALVLVTVAVRNSNVPEVQSVFGALQETAGMQWDESIGKLSFVNGFLPEEIQEVWSETKATPVRMPINGNVVHAWSQTEPYLLIDSDRAEVYAAASGEILSVSHGLEEERIIRIRHEDGSETIYGNLESCITDVGQQVHMGECIGRRIEHKPLAFEVRVNGRPIEPVIALE